MLRRLFLTMLTLALLPWGAYANTQAFSGAATVAYFVEEDGLQTVCARVEAAQPVQGDAILIAPHQCKGPALPGTPCNPVLGLLPDPVRLPAAYTEGPVPVTAVFNWIGRAPAPGIRPPRAS